MMMLNDEESGHNAGNNDQEEQSGNDNKMNSYSLTLSTKTPAIPTTNPNRKKGGEAVPQQDEQQE